MPLLKLTHVGLSVQGKTILQDISFEIDNGDILGVIGGSGSGKTSLFRTINLLQTPTEGNILYNDKDVLSYPPTTLRREIGYVFQKTHLFGGTVEDNLLYPYELMQQKPDWQEIKDFIGKANLPQDVIKKKPNELSGGEQQRIALIRSLIVHPRILLLDEITASLDEYSSAVIEKLILEQNQNRNVTILFISHNSEHTKQLAQKILCMKNGTISYFGTKENYYEREHHHE